ncbi:VOC family protein [Levilactobacillus mulengensis]|uniref:VOC family protein n=1 Tax=Levilactobacillus mulengensis TaxID=2486025 RepID=UPI000F79670D|nr:VOC family protein [Levilactobacillus mulengensis]
MPEPHHIFPLPTRKRPLPTTKMFLGATEVYRLSPDQQQAQALNLPPDTNLADITIYGGFKIMDLNFCFSDASGDQPQASNQVSVMLDINSQDPTAEAALLKLYQRVVASRQVTVKVPYKTQFWGNKMGTVIDRYGVFWIFNSAPWNR